MKKIRSSLLLGVLLTSLGMQTTTTLASVLETDNQESSELEVPKTEDETTQSEQESEAPTEPVIPPVEEEKPPVTEETEPPVVEEPTEKPIEKPTEIPVEPVEEEPTKPVEKPETPKVEETPPVSDKVVEQNVVEQTYSTSTYSQSSSAGSVTYNANKDTQDFINEIGEVARKIGLENDLYASVMIAQAILESGSGSSELSSEPNYNLFGIKGEYNGQAVSYSTSEDDGKGNLYTIQSNFRKYPSYKESLEDYADLMKNGISGNSDFYKGVHKTNAETYKEATSYLTGKYATDIYYHEKLNGLIETYHLISFDKEKVKAESMDLNNKKVDSFSIANPTNQETSNFIVPLEKGYVVSSPFSHRDNPVTGVAEHHDGIDLAVDGGTPIYASNSGTVIQSGFEAGAGNYVMVQHDNGLITNYFHMSEIVATTGENVKTGDVLGLVGSTGNSTGNHLHFGISTGIWSGYLNPSDYIPF